MSSDNHSRKRHNLLTLLQYPKGSKAQKSQTRTLQALGGQEVTDDDDQLHSSAYNNSQQSPSPEQPPALRPPHPQRASSLTKQSPPTPNCSNAERSRTFSGNVNQDDSASPPPDFAGSRRRQNNKSSSFRYEHSGQSTAHSGRQESSSVPTTRNSRDMSSRIDSDDTAATSIRSHSLAPLQVRGPPDESDKLEPVAEDDPGNYDLVQPVDSHEKSQDFSLEKRVEDMFSREHLQTIFQDSNLLQKFTRFLGGHRRESMRMIIYYLDALKALRALEYANAIADSLGPLAGYEFTAESPPDSRNEILEDKVTKAFDALVAEELPAFVTHTYINIVSVSIKKRINGTLPPHLREASEGLAEVFCLSDPSRQDNPIVFASEEFHRTTQYGNSYAVGRNCRFLQGPQTKPDSTRRLREAIRAGKDHCETFLNYRRDGAPFLNLLMVAPLRDNQGVLRYFIGAQVDVSGLAKEATGLDALQRMLAKREVRRGRPAEDDDDEKDEFQELTEMFNTSEIDIVQRFGGRMHRLNKGNDDDATIPRRPRLLLKESSGPDSAPEEDERFERQTIPIHGRLVGVYQHYLLVRPYPSLRIIFTSPSMRVPGILQSPFMNKIGSSERVREELEAALAEGRGVTAKVRWITHSEDEGRNRWLHCTPLLGIGGEIGVWMIVIVDDESSSAQRRFRPAPPVATDIQSEENTGHRRRYDRHHQNRPFAPSGMRSPPSLKSAGSEVDFTIR